MKAWAELIASFVNNVERIADALERIATTSAGPQGGVKLDLPEHLRGTDEPGEEAPEPITPKDFQELSAADVRNKVELLIAELAERGFDTSGYKPKKNKKDNVTMLMQLLAARGI